MAALALRLLFFFQFSAITDDSHIYANLATNWMQHGVYGQTQGGQPEKQLVPTDARLPGYPAFLAGIFWLFGIGNFKAVMLAQILVDLATCLIVADLAQRTVSERAARIAFVLAALCPFLANYAAAVLTETLEIFFTALALDCAAAALNRMPEAGVENQADTGALNRTYRKFWAAAGAGIAACILVRPDGGILLAAVAVYLASLAWRHPARRKQMADILVAGMIVSVIALAPLAPWTIRNFRTLHHSSHWLRGTPTRRMNSSPEVSTAGSKPGSPTTLRWKKSTGTFPARRLTRENCHRVPSIIWRKGTRPWP